MVGRAAFGADGMLETQCRAVRSVQTSVPNGLPRTTLRRSRFSSPVLSGVLTRSTQSAGRSIGQSARTSRVGSSACAPALKAAVWPLLGPLGQRGADRIPLDITDHCQQMLVALHRERLEPTLVQMAIAHRPVGHSPPHRVRVRQPAEVIGDLAVSLGPDDKVPVVREDAVRQDPQGMPAIGLDHDPPEGLEVHIREKESHPADGSVKDVVDLASGGSAGCPRHGFAAYHSLCPLSN